MQQKYTRSSRAAQVADIRNDLRKREKITACMLSWKTKEIEVTEVDAGSSQNFSLEQIEPPRKTCENDLQGAKENFNSGTVKGVSASSCRALLYMYGVNRKLRKESCETNLAAYRGHQTSQDALEEPGRRVG
ncbi:hypothetical protein GOBAR_AA32415 [Gossypium barbadense]|uniref:Uncharacterized protein n=1 Tax=Gossypium barbadense TaxID=3634 RepID=A0A2P5WB33_GOSBA|nr:hypothetical protein GOBAR_AA32415 [Gossypium barbadense]